MELKDIVLKHREEFRALREEAKSCTDEKRMTEIKARINEINSYIPMRTETGGNYKRPLN